jgi:hypothetical protein
MKTCIGGLDEYLTLVSEVGHNAVYRGHSSSAYKLLPTLGRLECPHSDLVEVEQRLTHEFKRRSHYLQKALPRSEWEWAVMGRHYGLHTRLTDWTTSPYVALYFALSHFPARDFTSFSIFIEPHPRRVALEALNLAPWELKDNAFLDPLHLEERVSNQDAVVCAHAIPDKEYDSPDLVRFTFRCDEHTIDRCERTLWDIGMRHARILPGLDGLCRDINQFVVRGPGRVQSSSSWRPVDSSLIRENLTVGDLEDRMISKRDMLLNLKFHGIRSLIGIGIEVSGSANAQFHSWLSVENAIEVLDPLSGQISTFDCEDNAVKTARIRKEHISHMYPDGKLYIRRKIGSQSRRDAEPGAPPNGGPATPVGNSEVTEGPATMS